MGHEREGVDVFIFGYQGMKVLKKSMGVYNNFTRALGEEADRYMTKKLTKY